MAKPPLDFSSYQQQAMAFRVQWDSPVVYATLGLAGEAGELANKVKKILRGDPDRAALEEAVRAEMGDVLWYLAALAADLKIDLADVAAENIKKLESRQTRGKLLGDGDKR